MQRKKIYKLSPSDFKYLWEDCKHCFWRKVVEGVALPSIGMPAIFGKMNNLVQDKVIDMNLKDINPDLPSGIFEHKERYLKSKPVPNSEGVFISGRFDLLTKFDDGTHGIIDLKITNPNSKTLYKFANQLHAYKYALEHPAYGQDKLVDKISKMGLVIMSPEDVSFKNDTILFNAKPVWIEFDEDMPTFFKFIDDISEFLNSELPEPTDSCAWCRYRKLTSIEPAPQVVQEDIPF